MKDEPRVAVFLANGFEEIEALGTIDILRRAGLDVTTVSVGADSDNVVTSSRGIPVIADEAAVQLNRDDIDVTVFPGGLPGATNLAADNVTIGIVRHVAQQGGITAAICAAPMALAAAGLLKGRAYTCYPGCESSIGGNYTGKRVEKDGTVITACGPGATAEFAFAILEALGKADKVATLKKGMLFKNL